ncbi:MAG: hypothetical protein HYX73_09895 [Acidobacteria bacterium]|nr:hypothetical protein [Acidobacteriota bacterium]
MRRAAKTGSPPDVQATLNKSAPHTKAQVLAIQIRADQQRAEQLLRQINLQALEALLK